MLTLPLSFRIAIELFSITARPDESYPLYSKLNNPFIKIGVAFVYQCILQFHTSYIPPNNVYTTSISDWISSMYFNDNILLQKWKCVKKVNRIPEKSTKWNCHKERNMIE